MLLLRLSIFLFIFNIANADWSLNNSLSDLNFMSIKQSNIVEIHRFKQLNGKVDSQGNVDLQIILLSLDTNIGIRDERMHNWLFKTELYPKVFIHTQVDIEKINDLTTGEILRDTVNATLNIAGNPGQFDASIIIVKLEDKILVTTAQPIVINATEFNLQEGVEKLREIAGLKMISMAVPVTFSLVFEQE